MIEDEVQRTILYAIGCGEASIAILCSLTIVYTYLRFKELRKKSLELVVYLAISDIGGNIGDTLGYNHSGALCTFQAMLFQFFDMASVLWTVVIAYTLYSVVVKQVNVSVLWPFHLFVWGGSAFLMLLPTTTNSYGDSGPWCWIRAEMNENWDHGTMWRVIAFYGPLWTSFLVVVFLYWRVTSTINLYAKANKKDKVAATKLKKLAQSLRMYPVIFVCAWTVATILRIYDWWNGNSSDQDFTVGLVRVLFNGSVLQGIANSVAYGMTPAVRTKWAELRKEMKTTRSCMPLFNLDKMDRSKGEAARNDDLRNTIGNQSAAGDDMSGAEGGGEYEDEYEGDAETANPDGAASDEQEETSRKSGFASWTPNKKAEGPASELV